MNGRGLNLYIGIYREKWVRKNLILCGISFRWCRIYVCLNNDFSYIMGRGVILKGKYFKCLKKLNEIIYFIFVCKYIDILLIFIY